MVDDLQRLFQSYKDSPEMYYRDTWRYFVQADFNIREVEGYLRCLVAKRDKVGDKAFTANLSDEMFTTFLKAHDMDFAVAAFDEIRGWRNVFAHCVFTPPALAERLGFPSISAGATYYLERKRGDQVAHVEKVLARFTPPIRCARCKKNFVGGCQCKCIPMYLGRMQMEKIANWVEAARNQLIDDGINTRFHFLPANAPTR